MSDLVSKSWFCVFNNPQDHGYTGTPEEICEKLKLEWVGDSQTRSGAWAYCISELGLHHIHMVLEDTKTMRFSAVKKSYCQGMHFEPTKGNKLQADDYINKRGKFEEKGETIEYICYHGEIKGAQGKRSDLTSLYNMIQDGFTPVDILRENPNAYRYKSTLKDMYYLKRSDETPTVRDVKVYWHTGVSGSGKSYERVKLIEQYGEDNIYYLTSFNSGAFDNYNGQKILWIEDFRGEFKFQDMLRYLDVYKAEIPARYSNAKALWNEVHITSVLTPQQCYSEICANQYDRIEQLLRRITSLVYHYKLGNEYCKCEFSPYALYNDILTYIENAKQIQIAIGDLSEYEEILSESEEINDKKRNDIPDVSHTT